MHYARDFTAPGLFGHTEVIAANGKQGDFRVVGVRRLRNGSRESNLQSCLRGLPLHTAGSAISSPPKV